MKYQIKHTYNLQFIPNKIFTKHSTVLKNGPTSSNQLFQKKKPLLKKEEKLYEWRIKKKKWKGNSLMGDQKGKSSNWNESLSTTTKSAGRRYDEKTVLQIR